ncbi:MAG: hypothetical protein A3J29_21340 [Acidobacteria bacterium RIFCSPLOWO2_12_FULL_67_14b]|nr:MAG: hypothetical protein A3J29_21340 [Acidobacteria bacterium RIFCSPLOWO2_12_FULL_67_14b]
MTRWMVVGSMCAVASCAAGPPGPAELALGQDACGSCRMTIVSGRTAAQIVAPGEEPQFFDELGCLRDRLRAAPLPAGAVIYVADHRTQAWVDARTALFTQTQTPTPMASGLLAHADAPSRDADPAARGGSPVAASAMFGSQERSAVP